MAWAEAHDPRATRSGKTKKKGRAGVPCSPSLGRKRPRWARHGRAGPTHSAPLHMGVFVLRCNLAPPRPHELREECGRRATRGLPNGNA